MRAFKSIAAAAVATLLLAASLFSLVGCSSEPRKKIFYGYFDTVCVFSDYSGMNRRKFNATVKEVEAAIKEYHELFDIYHEYDGITNLKSVNDMAGKGAVAVDERIIDLLIFSVEMYNVTGGKVNIAMGAPLSLWHTLRAEGKRIPTDDELNAVWGHFSIDSLIIDEKNLTVEITDPEMTLDVGAIAKGYVAQRIKEELSEAGISGAVLDFGGNICAIGTKKDGSGWSTGIKNPDSAAESAYVRTVTVSDDAVATSGVYERAYTVDGVSYHHIIDPETLMPENRYLSVSVQTKDSGVADALSTAIFNMDIYEAQDFIATRTAIEVTLVLPDGSVKVLKNY